MSQKLIAALKQLDTNNDDHWTNDGLPRVDVVKQFSGVLMLNREDVARAWPGFHRGNTAEALPGNGNDGSLQEGSVEDSVKETEQSEMEIYSNGQLAELEKQLGAANEALEAAKSKKAEADRLFLECSNACDALIMQISEIRDSVPQAQSLRGYFERQHIIREERAEKLEILRQNKGLLKTLTEGLMAPIDAARKRAKGK